MYVALVCLLSLLCARSFGQHLFEFAEVDSLSDLWSNRNNEINNRYETCGVNVLGERINGLCKSKVDCLFSGGTPRGRCGLVSTCCTYERSCGRSTNSRISYFTNVGNALDGRLCSYRVNLMNENVCQIRLDFLEFDLEPATMENNLYVCTAERFYAEPNAFAPMCGTNQGQHLYIHVGRSQQQVILHVRRSRPESRWNIKVTQLECGRGGVRDGRGSHSPDVSLLAPQGCLQFYSETTGTFRNFGYNGPYVANQAYSICFRRTPDICGVKFVPRELSLTVWCRDYFYVPNAVNNLLQCQGNNPGLQPFELNVPGPLYITFYAFAQSDYDVRFRIDYELTPCS